LILLGSIKHTQKQFDDAIEAYEKVIKIDPTRKNIYLFLGAIYIDQGNLDKATSVYKKMVNNFPKSDTGYSYLGKIYAKQKNFTQAEIELNRAIEINPMALDARFERLKIYKTRTPSFLKSQSKTVTKKSGDFIKNETIIKEYMEILKLYPGQSRAFIELGLFYHSIGKKEKAEKIFKDLGTRSLNDRQIIEQVIFLYITPKKYSDAVIIIEGMLKKVPDNSNLHYIVGVIHEEEGRKDIALNHFKKIKKDSSFFKNSVFHIAYLYQAGEKKT